MKEQNGFTLIELLVTMTIVAITLGLISSSLRFSVDTADIVESRLSAAESLQLAHRVVRQQLQQAIPVPIFADSEVSDIEFAGTMTEIRFVASIAGLNSNSGFYDVVLSIEADSQAEDETYLLVSRYTRRGGSTLERVLLEGLSAAEFAYFDTQSARPADWQSEWMHKGVLPGLIRLQTASAHSDVYDLPPLIVSPMISMASWKTEI